MIAQSTLLDDLQMARAPIPVTLKSLDHAKFQASPHRHPTLPHGRAAQRLVPLSVWMSVRGASSRHGTSLSPTISVCVSIRPSCPPLIPDVQAFEDSHVKLMASRVCTICNRQFSKAEHLKRHERSRKQLLRHPGGEFLGYWLIFEAQIHAQSRTSATSAANALDAAMFSCVTARNTSRTPKML